MRHGRVLSSLRRGFVVSLAASTWLVLAACGGGQSAETQPCCGPNEEWTATATWREQGKERFHSGTEAIAQFDREGERAEVQGELVDVLRAAAVLQVDAGAAGQLEPADVWRARLLLDSIGIKRDSQATIDALRQELAIASESRAPAAMVREAAVRANLAAALTNRAVELQLKGDALRSALEEAFEVVDGWCQIPEALLNAAAIQLAMAEVAPAAGDRARSIALAQSILSYLDSASAGSCSEERGAFMGVVGNGTRAVYLLDCSGSMRGAIDQLHREAKATIRGLSDDMSFGVIFFGGSAYELKPEQGLLQFGDGTGLFRRALLGRDLKAVFRVFDDVESNLVSGNSRSPADLPGLHRVPRQGDPTSTQPGSGLERALDLNPSTVFMLTDGEVEPDWPGQFEELTTSLKQRGIVVHTTLFFNPSTSPDQLTRQIDPLARMSLETGGRLVVVPQGQSGVRYEATGDLRRFVGVTESLRQRAERRGYWTPESERQYWALVGQAHLMQSDAGASVDAFTNAMGASSGPGEDAVDIVTAGAPVAANVSWPTNSGTPIPSDGALLLRRGLALSLAGNQEQALVAFDDAAVAWAACATDAAAAGQTGRADRFADLACRALLLQSFVGADRAAVAASKALDRAQALGVVRSDGWSQQLLAAGAGALSNLRAGAVLSVHGGPDAAEREFELGLTRAFYRRSGGDVILVTADASGSSPAELLLARCEFPSIERDFFIQVMRSVREDLQ